MNKFLSSLICIILIAITGCSDILEEDIRNEIVKLVAPANNAVVQQSSVNFWWEELDGATTYQIQVVSPNFDSILILIANEVIENGTTNLELTLSAGKYQWKVLGQNFGYETDSAIIYDLVVENDTTMSLQNEILVLTKPPLDETTADQNIQFSWQELPIASDYNFQIASPDFSNNAFILSNQLVESTTVSMILAEGSYQWRVRGQNNVSVSPYTERKLTIDLTPPSQPFLIDPVNAATVNLPVLLDWDSDLDSERDTLYVFKDSLLTANVLKIALDETEYSFNDNSSNIYFWRVRTVDLAGNTSLFSELRKFNTQ